MEQFSKHNFMNTMLSTIYPPKYIREKKKILESCKYRSKGSVIIKTLDSEDVPEENSEDNTEEYNKQYMTELLEYYIKEYQEEMPELKFTSEYYKASDTQFYIYIYANWDFS